MAALVRACDELTALVAEVDPAVPVGSCPGWRVADLVEHVGGVHDWARHAVVVGDGEGRRQPLPAGASTDRSSLAAWYRGRAEPLAAALAERHPDDAAWVFGPGPATVRWWVRRQVHEVTLHTWDLLAAAGLAGAWRCHPALAWDAVHEVASMFYPRQVSLGRCAPLPGRLVLRAVDLPEAPATLGEGPVAAEVRAPAADVLLGLWGRAPLPDDAAAVVGDRAVTP